ncbi:MAG: 4Fe-4S binding protein [Candidatus Bathyarchaeota archaeon]|nr:4Fe-4S binding protein [Candidatus Bathyarchaeota archaeon]
MIGEICDNNLCNSCGTCFSACPQDAISFIKNRTTFKFFSDPSKCTKCGACLRVCPGLGVDFKKLNNVVFQRFPQNKLVGNFKSCYIASSRNKKIRYEASSGGVISSFLVFLLKEI